MNKHELTIIVSKITGKPMSETASVINTLFDAMMKAILEGESISIAPFGSFSLKTHKQKVGYDPYHKVHIIRPEGKYLRFRPSASLHKMIRERYDKGPVKVIEEDRNGIKAIYLEEKIPVET
jgi:nucleoid DNA-binding protein